MKRTRKKPLEPVQLVPGLREAVTAGETYQAVVNAWNEGRLSSSQARTAVDLVKVRASVVAAEEYRRRLELLEAGQRLRLPAARSVIEGELVSPRSDIQADIPRNK